ncbi:MAG: triose-phosphate isomerase [bacterium]|nr:triose-phosphate isomerase [bacterium]
MSRMPLIIANWKMNVPFREAEKFAKKIAAYVNSHDAPGTYVVCPSSECLSSVGSLLKSNRNIFLGAQNCATDQSGAFTGESSVRSLAESGCTYCIVGHSERRSLFLETDEIISKKLSACLAIQKVKPILCIGESMSERKNGLTKQVLARQLASAFLTIASKDRSRVIIAYEPIWAIGSGAALTREDTKFSVDLIREIMKSITSPAPTVLYGGSVDEGNIASFLSVMDGVLIGTASQNQKTFLSVLRAIKMIA